MATKAQKRAVANHRARRRESGVVRFEVSAPASDKELIRSIARRLSEAAPADHNLRSTLRAALGPSLLQEPGSLWRALRASPLVGAELDLERERAVDRDVDI